MLVDRGLVRLLSGEFPQIVDQTAGSNLIEILSFFAGFRNSASVSSRFLSTT